MAATSKLCTATGLHPGHREPGHHRLRAGALLRGSPKAIRTPWPLSISKAGRCRWTLFSGKPPGYRKTPDGRYALWSVGFDGEDDGGKRVLDEKRPEKTRFYDPSYAGDWVWDFPVR